MRESAHLIPFPTLKRVDSISMNDNRIVFVLVNIRNVSTSTSSDVLLRFASDTERTSQFRRTLDTKQKLTD